MKTRARPSTAAGNLRRRRRRGTGRPRSPNKNTSNAAERVAVVVPFLFRRKSGREGGGPPHHFRSPQAVTPRTTVVSPTSGTRRMRKALKTRALQLLRPCVLKPLGVEGCDGGIPGNELVRDAARPHDERRNARRNRATRALRCHNSRPTEAAAPTMSSRKRKTWQENT